MVLLLIIFFSTTIVFSLINISFYSGQDRNFRDKLKKSLVIVKPGNVYSNPPGGFAENISTCTFINSTFVTRQ